MLGVERLKVSLDVVLRLGWIGRMVVPIVASPQFLIAEKSISGGDTFDENRTVCSPSHLQL
jgi:hypothetical protein